MVTKLGTQTSERSIRLHFEKLHQSPAMVLHQVPAMRKVLRFLEPWSLRSSGDLLWYLYVKSVFNLPFDFVGDMCVLRKRVGWGPSHGVTCHWLIGRWKSRTQSLWIRVLYRPHSCRYGRYETF